MGALGAHMCSLGYSGVLMVEFGTLVYSCVPPGTVVKQGYKGVPQGTVVYPGEKSCSHNGV